MERRRTSAGVLPIPLFVMFCAMARVEVEARSAIAVERKRIVCIDHRRARSIN